MARRRVGAGPLRAVIGERLFCRTQGASGGLRAERQADGGSAENVGNAGYRLDTRRGAAGSIIPQCTAQRRRRECRMQQLGGRQQSGHPYPGEALASAG
eukprot:scaffold121744_cov45-Phaeocystis_antarctica.AAC.1